MKNVVFYPELSTDERIKQLKKVCKSKTVKAFKRSLSDEEIEKELRTYADLGLELREKEDEKAEIMKTHNEGIKAVSANMEISLDVIQNGKKEVSDEIYYIPNYGTGQMEGFDKFGELIETRGLTVDETTGHLFNNDGEESDEVCDKNPKSVGEVVDKLLEGAETVEAEDLPTAESSDDDEDPLWDADKYDPNETNPDDKPQEVPKKTRSGKKTDKPSDK